MSKKDFETPTPDEEMYAIGADLARGSDSVGYTPTPIAETWGTVTNCERLNIRREPKKKNSEIIRVVNKGTKLLINQSKSTIMWYSVTTETGAEGYVMKEYITV